MADSVKLRRGPWRREAGGIETGAYDGVGLGWGVIGFVPHGIPWWIWLCFLRVEGHGILV